MPEYSGSFGKNFSRALRSGLLDRRGYTGFAQGLAGLRRDPFLLGILANFPRKMHVPL
jgi:hypothetical protein